jgi:hypothetical protein
MQDLRQLLVTAGLNMAGIQLLTAVTVTGDGQFIAGAATTPTTSLGATISYMVQFCDAAILGPCRQVTLSTDPDFILTPFGPSSLSVVPGNAALTALRITPVNGFNRGVGFSCSGLPAGAACVFAPPTVAAGSSGATELTISTTAPAMSSTVGGGLVGILIVPGLLLVPALLLAAARRRRASSGVPLRCMRYAAPVALALVTSCGDGGGPLGPNAGTPAGSYEVTVTASTTAGAPVMTQSVVLILNVSE